MSYSQGVLLDNSILAIFVDCTIVDYLREINVETKSFASNSQRIPPLRFKKMIIFLIMSFLRRRCDSRGLERGEEDTIIQVQSAHAKADANDFRIRVGEVHRSAR